VKQKFSKNKIIMKKWNHLMLIVMVTTFGVSLSAQTCKSSASAQLTDNAALLSSPRYREDHPELQRIPTFAKEAQAKEDQIKTQVAKLMENRAWADSPRTREEFPELQTVPLSSQAAQAKADQLKRQTAKLLENRAWADSPRTREEFPELQRAFASTAIVQVKAGDIQSTASAVSHAVPKRQDINQTSMRLFRFNRNDTFAGVS
jgi:hypothetical protein